MSRLLDRVPRVVVVVALIGAATALSVVDYLTDQQLSIALLFLALVSFVTWYDSGRSGALVCVVVAVALLFDAAVLRDGEGGRAIYYWNAAQTALLCAVAVAFVGRLKVALETERALAWIDDATGLFRRAAFGQLLVSEVDRCQRYGRPFTLGLIEVGDRAAEVRRPNSDAVDELMREAAATVRRTLRAADAIGRFAPGTIAVLLPETPDTAALTALRRLEQELRADAPEPACTITAVAFMTAPTSADHAVREAEAVLRAAVSDGDGEIRLGVWNNAVPPVSGRPVQPTADNPHPRARLHRPLAGVRKLP